MPAQHPRSCLVLSVALVGALPLAARAAEAETSQARASQTALTTYDAGFFAAFAPATALDIVRRVPGFSLDIGNAEVRGLADAAGNVVAVSRDGGRGAIVSAVTYDVLGRKLQQIDPDAGTLTYAYNAAGDVIRQTDAQNQMVS